MACWLNGYRVRVRVRAQARECTSCLFLFSFFIFMFIIYKCGEHLCLQIAYEYSIDDVTATWTVVNLASRPSTFLHKLNIVLEGW